MWVGLIQSVEDLNRTERWLSLWARENSPADYLDFICNITLPCSAADGLQIKTEALPPWVSSLPAHSANFELSSLHIDMSQFFYVYKCICKYTHVYTYIHTHTLIQWKIENLYNNLYNRYNNLYNNTY